MDLFDDKVKRGQRTRNQNLTLKFGSNSESTSREHNELILKVASNIKGNNVAGSVDYITRNKPEHELEEFIEPFNEMNETLDRHELEQLKNEWKEEFSDPKKIESRNMTHLVLSIDVKPTEDNKKKFDSAARDFLNERFGDEGFRYIAVQHNDTNKPHFHILVNNNNLETEKKLRIDINWLHESRIMASEHLKAHGINQEATFKKDRQFIKQQSIQSEKEYKEVSNWFDAKLKSAARNDEHFKQLKSQWDVIQAVKSGVATDYPKAEGVKFSQKELEVNKKISELKKDMLTYEHYNSRTAANQAVRDLVKEANPKQSVFKQALQRSAQRDEKEVKAEQRKSYFLAKELVRGREIVKSSPDIPKREKREILATIDKQAERFTSQGIDIKKLEREYLSQLSDNKQYATAMKSLNAAERSTDKQIKKDGQLSQSDAQKRMVRILDAIHSASTSSLTKNEKTRLQQSKQEVFNNLSERGINTLDIETKWKEARAFKDHVAEVKSRLKSNSLESKLADQTQKTILLLSEQLKTSPPEYLSKKERYSSNVSLQRSQEALNTLTKNDFSHFDKATANMLKSLASLDQKISNGELKKANQQAFAITKSAIKLEKGSQSINVTDSQGRLVQQRLSNVFNELNHRGYDAESVKSKLELTEKVTSKAQEIKGLSMSRVRLKGFDKVQSEIDKVKKEVPNIDMKRDDKRQLNRDMAAKAKELEQARSMDVLSLDKKMDKIQNIVKNIERLTKPEYIKSLSHLEKLNNKREIESYGQQLGKLIDSSKKLVPSAPNKTVQKAYSDVLRQASKHVQEPSKGFER